MGRKLTKPKHEMGKSTGFTRFPDGTIELCPMYTESIDNAHAEEVAVTRLLETVTDICQQRLAAAQKARDAFWKRVAEDVGLNLEDTWSYKGGRLFKTPKEDENGLPK